MIDLKEIQGLTSENIYKQDNIESKIKEAAKKGYNEVNLYYDNNTYYKNYIINKLANSGFSLSDNYIMGRINVKW